MSPDDRDTEEPESERYDIEPPRSVFSALWLRVVVVVVVVGVVAALAVPYVLDWMSPPPPPRTTATKSAPPAMRTPVEPGPAAPAVAPGPAPAPPVRAGSAAERKEPSAARSGARPVPAPAGAQVGATEAEAEDKPAPPARRTRKESARRPARPAAKAPATRAPAATSGAYFVQVGAFRDREYAGRVAARLRGDKFRVEESTAGTGEAPRAAAEPAPVPAASPGLGDRYDVFVTGGSVADINAKLAGKGLATEAAANGVVVKPSLPLRDAVALSKDLASEGLKVQVRRAVGGASRSAPAPGPSRERAGGGEVLHRVRVGPFPDRAAAREALDALKEMGFRDSFIARGGT